ncbi:MAG TPA: succinate dehydrogenase, hydrophobic membrane anchor protein [Caulobacteraceae bacterium]|nr:succinate dehydrogenase, hydrophobic membrane anchor protein [Caulobacteraceae bacterium]
MTGYRTPLGRVRGLGAAKSGVADFITQRVSGAALVILLLWGVYAAVCVARGGYEGATGWLHAPLNATGVVLIIAVAALHMQIGMREIILDYIARPATKAFLLVLNVFIAWGAGVVGVLAVLKVALGGAG